MKIKIMVHQSNNPKRKLNFTLSDMNQPGFIQQVIHLLREEVLAYHNIQSKESERRVVLRTAGSIEFVVLKDIIRCEAEGRYTKVYYGENGFLYVSMHLKEVDGLIQSKQFIRCHNSHLVNKHKIRRYNKTDGGFFEMVNGDHVPVARARKDNVMSQLEDAPIQ